MSAVSGRLQVAGDSSARTGCSHDGSQACGATCLVFAERLGRQRIEPARCNVGLKLLVPRSGVVLDKPLPKPRHYRGRAWRGRAKRAGRWWRVGGRRAKRTLPGFIKTLKNWRAEVTDAN